MANDRDTLAQTLKAKADRESSFQFRIEHYQGLADELLAAGWRPPARKITWAAEADALPVGTILFHARCSDTLPCIWVRECGAAEIEDDPAGGTCDCIHWSAWGDEGTRYDSEDLECHLNEGESFTVLYVPTEEADRG